MKWEEKSFNEIGYIARGRSRYRPRNAEHLYGGDYPFIQTGDVKAANFRILDYSQTYNEVGLAQSKLWQKDTLCITIAANIAETALLGFDGCFPDSIIGFVSYDDKSDVRFVKYFFDVWKERMQRVSAGAAQDNLSLEKLLEFRIPTPPLTTQRRIASILSAYDDLIENNMKRIKLLEEAARCEYKSFIQDISKSKIKKQLLIKDCLDYYIGGGWGEDEYKEGFSEPAFVIRGTDFPNVRKGDIDSVPYRYHKISNLSSRKLNAGDLVFEVSGGSKDQPVGRSLLLTEKLINQFSKPVMCASFCKLLRPNSKISPEYIYLFLLEGYENGMIKQYEKHSASNIVNYGFEEFISERKLIVPPELELKYFTNKMKPIFNLISTLGEQNSKLREARDILLPRLMNGEVEV